MLTIIENIARLKLEVGRHVNNHVPINQDVSSNTNNFCNNLFVIYSNCCPIKEKEISFAGLGKAVDHWPYYDFSEPQTRIVLTV